jgi:hypothetical protein
MTVAVATKSQFTWVQQLAQRESPEIANYGIVTDPEIGEGLGSSVPPFVEELTHNEPKFRCPIGGFSLGQS